MKRDESTEMSEERGQKTENIVGRGDGVGYSVRPSYSCSYLNRLLSSPRPTTPENTKRCKLRGSPTRATTFSLGAVIIRAGATSFVMEPRTCFVEILEPPSPSGSIGEAS